MTKRKTFGVPAKHFEYLDAVHALTGLSPREKAVLSALAGFSNHYGYCFPSQSRAAKNAGCSVRTFQRGINDLTERGLVRKVSRTRLSRRTSTCGYALIVPVGRPTRQYVASISQCVGTQGDSMTGLNKSIEQNTQHGWQLIRTVEDAVLEKLKPVIDFSQTPDLISLARVSFWLFNRQHEEGFDTALKRLLEEADKLREELAAVT